MDTLVLETMSKDCADKVDQAEIDRCVKHVHWLLRWRLIISLYSTNC